MASEISIPDTSEQTAQERESLRLRLRAQHESAVAKLIAERDDLKGVHAHADFVADAARWTA